MVPPVVPEPVVPVLVPVESVVLVPVVPEPVPGVDPEVPAPEPVPFIDVESEPEPVPDTLLEQDAIPIEVANINITIFAFITFSFMVNTASLTTHILFGFLFFHFVKISRNNCAY